MKLVRVKELGLWLVANYDKAANMKLEVFVNKDDAKDYMDSKKPTLLDKFKLWFEKDK